MSKKTSTTTAPQPAVQEAPPLADVALMSVVRVNQQQWMEHTGNARRHGEQARQIRQRIEEMSAEIHRLGLNAAQEERYAHDAAETARAYEWALAQMNAKVPDLPSEPAEEHPGQQAWPPPSGASPIEAAARDAAKAGAPPYTAAWQDPAPTGQHPQAGGKDPFQAFQAAHDEHEAAGGGR